MNFHRNTIAFFAICFLTPIVTFAQEGQQHTYSVQNWWNPNLDKFSPIVQGDGKISFNIRAPRASQVTLVFGEWDVVHQTMHKNDDGIWNITIGPIAPGIYAYHFDVDGIKVPDWANPIVKTGTELYSSVVEVSGKDQPRFDEFRNIEYGVLQLLTYMSTPLKKMKGVTVYLPAQYFEQPHKTFPTLYLRHGGGDDENSWSSASGRAHVILENLIADGKADPMVVVMTNGMTDGSWAGGSSKEGVNLLADELFHDIVPLVESRYRVRREKEMRAIAGLSMGGGQAYIIGLGNLDKFSWIGEFSSGLLSDTNFDINDRVPSILDDPKEINRQLRLLWVGCGIDDDRYHGHLQFKENLEKLSVKHMFWAEKGGHEWSVWRNQLYEFYQLLFK